MKFLYVFPLTTRDGVVLERSYDTAEMLRNRADNDEDKAIIEELIVAKTVGAYNQLSTGEFIFVTA